MAVNHEQELAKLRERIETMGAYLHIERKRPELADLELKSAAPGFWDGQEKAQATMSKASALRDEIAEYDAALSSLEDAEVANELALEEDDGDLDAEVAFHRRAGQARGRPRACLVVRRRTRLRRRDRLPSTPVKADSRRRTGPICSSACTRATASARAGR